MLRAALIGFPSSGKSTLFQLMTSARDGAGGKGDVRIGISKVPDARLDVLTGMYNPKKRVPATVEFTDIAVVAKAGGAQALVDVANYKNADALVHVVRAFRDETVAHPSGSVDPARDASNAISRRGGRRSSNGNATSCSNAGRRSKRGARCARSRSPATI